MRRGWSVVVEAVVALQRLALLPACAALLDALPASRDRPLLHPSCVPSPMRPNP